MVDLLPPDPDPSPVPRRRPLPSLRRIGAGALDELMAERARWSLWLAVAVGAGIAAYFALPVEPPSWGGWPVPGLAALVAATAAAVLGRERPAVVLPALVIAALALGFAAAHGRALAVAAPVIERELGPVTISARVRTVEAVPGSHRLVLDHLTIQRLPAERTPAMVRVRLSPSVAPPRPGTWVSLRAKLLPPPEPSAPGGFQYPRQAWFQRLGGVGYATTPWRAQPEQPPPEGWERAQVALAGLRGAITGRILEVLPGDDGQVAAAMVTGDEGGISRPLIQAYRDSGIAHLLSISGLHMTMVAGLVFVGVRGLLALIPAIALRFHIKKWTAAVALVVTFFYLLISGNAVPTQRSFVMAALMLAGVLLDRRAVSMRSVAWAGMVVLLWQPEALVGASFQMSFGAVVALIAVYEGPNRIGRRLEERFGPILGKGLSYIHASILTTLVAGTATAPYAAYHFSRFTTYQVAANLLAIPLTGLWVMPAALIAVLLMPFGLDEPVLRLLGAGVAVCNDIARAVAAWPGASIPVPPLPVAGMVLVTVGGLWLCLWQRRWRFLGLLPIVCGLAAAYLVEMPDVLLSGDGKVTAVRATDGHLLMSPGRGQRIARETWKDRFGGASTDDHWPGGVDGPDAYDQGERHLACDPLGCVYRAHGRTVALGHDPDALPDDCEVATVVVSPVPVRRPCPAARLVIDRFTLLRQGAHALWLSGHDIRVATAAGTMGNRPWTPRKWTVPSRPHRRAADPPLTDDKE
ncbi:MAG: ComEC family competence protein [Alphaproteobacteria bacterium]